MFDLGIDLHGKKAVSVVQYWVDANTDVIWAGAAIDRNTINLAAQLTHPVTFLAKLLLTTAACGNSYM